MTIESDLKRIADSLEAIAAHVTGGEVVKRGPGRPAGRGTKEAEAPAAGAVAAVPTSATAPAASTPQPTAEPAAKSPSDAPQFAFTDIKERMRVVITKANQHRPKLVELLASKGAQDPKGLPEADYAWFMAQTEAFVPKAA
jgi:hypothetical protein